MNKYLLLTSSAMIVARVASAALETDAKENKAVVNKLEFNRKYSELTPPTLVIPPFSSAKDYKRLAGICFLGVGLRQRNNFRQRRRLYEALRDHQPLYRL